MFERFRFSAPQPIPELTVADVMCSVETVHMTR